METLGKQVVVVGIAVSLIGAIIWVIGTFAPGFKPGRLPGDIVIEKPQMSFYFPIVTMLLVSLVVSGLMWLIGALKR